MKQPVAYTRRRRRWWPPTRPAKTSPPTCPGSAAGLEVLSIVKRKDALGLLAHNDTEERWTRTRTELLAFLRIACAGMAAEELWFGQSTTGPGGRPGRRHQHRRPDVGALGMTDSLVSFLAMEEGLAGPLPARDAPSLLARRPPPAPAEVADPGPAG